MYIYEINLYIYVYVYIYYMYTHSHMYKLYVCVCVYRYKLIQEKLLFTYVLLIRYLPYLVKNLFPQQLHLRAREL